MSGGGDELNAADQGQVFGVVLAAAGIVVTLITWSRTPGDNGGPGAVRPAPGCAGQRVGREESRVRAALRVGIAVADVVFDDVVAGGDRPVPPTTGTQAAGTAAAV